MPLTCVNAPADHPVDAGLGTTRLKWPVAVVEFLTRGGDVPDELLSRITPGHSHNIHFLGVINVDVEAEPAKLDAGG